MSRRLKSAALLALLVGLLAVGLLPAMIGSTSPRVARAALYSAGGTWYSNFTVSPKGYVTVYLYGVPSPSKVLLWWGLENKSQSGWYVAVPETINGTTYYVKGTTSGNNETKMVYNSTINAFVVTVGPFLNGTFLAYVFNVNGTIWINYEGHAFWNFNVFVNPPMKIIGYTRTIVFSNCSVEIQTIGRPPDTMILWYGITTGNQTGLPWYTTAGTPGANQSIMQYSPYNANYTVMIGPFKNGTWIQWVYHDNTTGWWIHNSNVSSSANFALHVICPSAVTTTTTTNTTTTTTTTSTTSTTTSTTSTVTATVTQTVTSAVTTTLTTTTTSVYTTTVPTTVTSTTTAVSTVTVTKTTASATYIAASVVVTAIVVGLIEWALMRRH